MAAKKKQEAPEMTLEEGFEKLDEILEALENRETTLEESFQNYQRGMELLKQCNEKIDRVEKQMKIINEAGEADEF